MARIRNEAKYKDTRAHLLSVGMELIRSGSYEGVSVSDILKAGQAPKGSFYHYFESKEAFGLEVAAHYHALQMEGARKHLRHPDRPAIDSLFAFFHSAYLDYEARQFGQGCLMCNLSTEIADEQPRFQEMLDSHWRGLAGEIAQCISRLDRAAIGLAHLSDAEAGDWLLNAWSGALTRMKAAGDGSPLRLFLKTTFKKEL